VGSETELQRLLLQVEALEPQARWLLDQLDIKAGARAIDIGCGPLGILNLLSERLAPAGRAVGLEREAARFVEMARSETARRGLRNVEIVLGNALSNGLERASFDLVHERLVLVNVADRDAFIRERGTRTAASVRGKRTILVYCRSSERESLGPCRLDSQTDDRS
jgi:2-polyprenyl-3-methyl-5-hydroxy-6-metoxy-1,4-benzoquinol methylase